MTVQVQATTTTIRKAVPGDIHHIGVTLSRAFQDDPVVAWIIPDAGRRRAIAADDHVEARVGGREPLCESRGGA